MVWVVLPVKDLVQAKTRLSGVLAPHERRTLAQAMVEDVLSVLEEVAEIEGICVLSEDPAADLLAHKYPIEVLSETELGCNGLNRVVAAGVQQLRQRGIRQVMVMHSDLPLIQAPDVEALLHVFAQVDCDMVIAPDLAAKGTNVMVFDPQQFDRFQYGPGSCQLHQNSAGALGLQCRLYHNEHLGLDVDSPGDLLHLYHELLAGQRSDHSAELLLSAGVAQRLSLIERAGLDPYAEVENHDAV